MGNLFTACIKSKNDKKSWLDQHFDQLNGLNLPLPEILTIFLAPCFYDDKNHIMSPEFMTYLETTINTNRPKDSPSFSILVTLGCKSLMITGKLFNRTFKEIYKRSMKSPTDKKVLILYHKTDFLFNQLS